MRPAAGLRTIRQLTPEEKAKARDAALDAIGKRIKWPERPDKGRGLRKELDRVLG